MINKLKKSNINIKKNIRRNIARGEWITFSFANRERHLGVYLEPYTTFCVFKNIQSFHKYMSHILSSYLVIVKNQEDEIKLWEQGYMQGVGEIENDKKV